MSNFRHSREHVHGHLVRDNERLCCRRYTDHSPTCRVRYRQSMPADVQAAYEDYDINFELDPLGGIGGERKIPVRPS
jgi:hypothetical protein